MTGHDHSAALLIPCPDCHALCGVRCSHYGVTAAVPHPARLDAVRAARPVLVGNWLDVLERAVA
jgi:hypothetical protein